MLFQGKQLLSGNWLLDGLTLFFMVLTLYVWGRWLVVHLLFLTERGYKKYQDEVWDHEGRNKGNRKFVTWVTILCIEIAAYLVR